MKRTARLRRLDAGWTGYFSLYLNDFIHATHLLSVADYGDSRRRKLSPIAAEQARQAGWAKFDMGSRRETRNGTLRLRNVTKGEEYAVGHRLSTRQREAILAGGVIPMLAGAGGSAPGAPASEK